MNWSFGQILDGALDLNLERQLVAESIRQQIGTQQWLAEFGTIQLNMGRQCGKTTAIRRRARKGDLVLTPNEQMSRLFSTEAFFNPTVKTFNQLETVKSFASELRFDRIWVDEAAMLKAGQLQTVFSIAMSTGVKQIILIG